MRTPLVLTAMTLLTGGLSAQAPAAAPPPPPAILGFALTGSATIGSQYIFRGLTQTDGRPTVQAELDLVHPSGFYVSVSFSNISWFTDQNLNTAAAPVPLGSVASASVEVDLFGGYKWGFAKDWALDAGLYRYQYPGSYGELGTFRNPNTTEAYLGLSYSWATLKYSRVISEDDFGVAKAKGSSYLDLSLAIPLGGSGWTAQLHGGKTTYNTASSWYNSQLNYTDFKLGLATEFKGYGLALAATNANTKDLDSTGVPLYLNAMGRNIGKGRVTFIVSKTF